MGQLFWQVAPDTKTAFSDFVSGLADGAANVVPGDYTLTVAGCPQCFASLCLSERPGALGRGGWYAPFPETMARAAQDRAASAVPICPTCGTASGAEALRTFYVGRVAPLLGDVLLVQFEWHGSGWNPPSYYVFSPPAGWQELGSSPTSDQIREVWGRAAHVASAAIAAYRALLDADEIVFRSISPEAALIAYDGRKPPKPDEVYAFANGKGLPPPYAMEVFSPGQFPEFLDSIGATPSVRKLMGARSAGLVLIVSEPAVRLRVGSWAAASKGAVSVDLDGQIEIKTQGHKGRLAIKGLPFMCAQKGATVDDVLFQQGLKGAILKSPKSSHSTSTGAPPYPAEIARGTMPIEAPNVPLAAASAETAPMEIPPPAVADVAAAAPPAAANLSASIAAPAPLPRPTAIGMACRTCTREAFFVRRLFDKGRLDSMYKPSPIFIEKKFVHATALMMTCGSHLWPVSHFDLGNLGINAATATNSAVASLDRDGVSVWRKITYDKYQQPTVGLVGEFAASVMVDDQWLEAAIQAAGVGFLPDVRVECLGENVIAFMPAPQVSAGSILKELRSVAKGWGLPEPRIAFSLSKKFHRPATGRGRILLQGNL